jgi:hypothetical protein
MLPMDVERRDREEERQACERQQQGCHQDQHPRPTAAHPLCPFVRLTLPVEPTTKSRLVSPYFSYVSRTLNHRGTMEALFTPSPSR